LYRCHLATGQSGVWESEKLIKGFPRKLDHWALEERGLAHSSANEAESTALFPIVSVCGHACSRQPSATQPTLHSSGFSSSKPTDCRPEHTALGKNCTRSKWCCAREGARVECHAAPPSNFWFRLAQVLVLYRSALLVNRPHASVGIVVQSHRPRSRSRRKLNNLGRQRRREAGGCEHVSGVVPIVKPVTASRRFARKSGSRLSWKACTLRSLLDLSEISFRIGPPERPPKPSQLEAIRTMNFVQMRDDIFCEPGLPPYAGINEPFPPPPVLTFLNLFAWFFRELTGQPCSWLQQTREPLSSFVPAAQR